MKCRDCPHLTGPTDMGGSDFPKVRCRLGIWDKDEVEQWYSYGEAQLDRGPVSRLGDNCSLDKA